ncbi:FKBP-type peptidyl-prolyl cis-trans isomerase [Microbacterium sp. P01]|uniref:FKBP-type peptidyl-prolyl cis-trans isomerase n=1 Tax=unclassified Microbacterium TaxID=2609290 RepID=UPI003670BAB1
MRKIPALIAVLGMASVGLVGCAAGGSAATCPRPASGDSSVLDAVTIADGSGDAPDVSVYTPFKVGATEFEDVTRGTGTAITSDEQVIVLDFTILDGTTGTTIIQTPHDGTTGVSALSAWGEQLFPTLPDALHCATAGSRVVVGMPYTDVAASAASQLGLKEGDSIVAVFDVADVYLPHAEGDSQFNDALGLPTVVRAPDGRPGIIVPAATAPTEVTVQTLIKGSGETVSGDSTVLLHQTSVSWDDRSVIDTTWDGPAAPTDLSTLPAGVADAVTGASVGSQLLVVVPADATESGASASATVYVVDVLGTGLPATQ